MDYYLIALLPPDTDCIPCKASKLTDEIYHYFASQYGNDSLYVSVGGSFFGQVKGFSLNPLAYTGDDIVFMNTVHVEKHLTYGKKPYFLFIDQRLYVAEMMTQVAYVELMQNYMHYIAVGYEIGGIEYGIKTH